MNDVSEHQFQKKATVAKISTAIALLISAGLILGFLLLGNSSTESSPGAIVTMPTVATTTSTTSTTTTTVKATTSTTLKVKRIPII